MGLLLIACEDLAYIVCIVSYCTNVNTSRNLFYGSAGEAAREDFITGFKSIIFKTEHNFFKEERPLFRDPKRTIGR